MMSNQGLSKLVEECGELITISAKKMAHMNRPDHPDGKGFTKERMEEEMADVCAAIEFVIVKFSLDSNKINTRLVEKLKLYHQWDVE